MQQQQPSPGPGRGLLQLNMLQYIYSTIHTQLYATIYTLLYILPTFIYLQVRRSPHTAGSRMAHPLPITRRVNSIVCPSPGARMPAVISALLGTTWDPYSVRRATWLWLVSTLRTLMQLKLRTHTHIYTCVCIIINWEFGGTTVNKSFGHLLNPYTSNCVCLPHSMCVYVCVCVSSLSS